MWLSKANVVAVCEIDFFSSCKIKHSIATVEPLVRATHRKPNHERCRALHIFLISSDSRSKRLRKASNSAESLICSGGSLQTQATSRVDCREATRNTAFDLKPGVGGRTEQKSRNVEAGKTRHASCGVVRKCSDVFALSIVRELCLERRYSQMLELSRLSIDNN